MFGVGYIGYTQGLGVDYTEALAVGGDYTSLDDKGRHTFSVSRKNSG